MEIDRPYFMENKEWYKFDKEKLKWVLTDKAPPKARESYVKFYDLFHDSIDEAKG